MSDYQLRCRKCNCKVWKNAMDSSLNKGVEFIIKKEDTAEVVYLCKECLNKDKHMKVKDC